MKTERSCRQVDADTIENAKRQEAAGIAVLAVLLLAAALVLAAHWPVLSANALLFDDDQYLIENRLVQNPGLDSTRRFLTEVLEPSTVRGYYQPLAMISLMLDCTLGGRTDNLMPFHRTSLFLHAANTLLVIVLFFFLFEKILPAAMVGILYGLHPTTIESVAWLSERKTVLATFFALWCLVFYVRYVRRPAVWRYIVCMAAFVLSLLTKPTTVAMPVLLLLLDWWPLKRLDKRAILEKLPFFALAALSALVTFVSQSRTSLAKLPGESGLARILLSVCHNIVFYPSSLLWPRNLSWYYPFPKPFDLSNLRLVVAAIGTLLIILALLISLRWTNSLLAGWLFFFLAVFPTLGVVGFHPVIAADRHIYFPVIGLLLPVGWFFCRLWTGDFSGLAKVGWRFVLAAAVLILGACEFALTRYYLAYWKDSETVYRYMLRSAPNVPVLLNNLANFLTRAGKTDEAIMLFNRSLQVEPYSAEVHNNLGNALMDVGRLDKAIEHYREAVRLKPKLAVARYNLARALGEQGDYDSAAAQSREAVRIKPDYIEAWNNLGFILARQRRFEQAVACYRKALELKPDHIIVHGRLGLALAELGDLDGAIEQFRIVLEAAPDDAEMHFNRGYLLELKGKAREALEHYRRALQLNPDYTEARQRVDALMAKQKSP